MSKTRDTISSLLQPALHPRVRAEGEDQQGADRPVGLPQVRLPAQGGQAILLLQEQRPPEPEVSETRRYSAVVNIVKSFTEPAPVLNIYSDNSFIVDPKRPLATVLPRREHRIDRRATAATGVPRSEYTYVRPA